AAREENQLRLAVESRVVYAPADRKTVNDFARGRVHNHHLRLVAATDKQSLGLCVICESGRSLSHADWKTIFHFQRFWIKDDDSIRVFAVQVNYPVGDDRLFAIGFSLYRPHHLAGFRVDGGNIMRAMIVSEDALRGRVIVDAVRSFSDINLLNQLQRDGVKHRNFIFPAVAGEPMFEFGSNRYPVYARRVGDGPD